MRVRYFPQTRLSESQESALASRFDEVVLTVLDDGMSLPSHVRGCLSAKEVAKKGGALFEEWRKFSGLHGEGMHAYTLGGCRHFDPLGEALSSQIRGEVIRQLEGASTEDDERALAAHVFLSLCEEHDSRQKEVEAELAAIESSRLGVFDELKGELGGVCDETLKSDGGSDLSPVVMEKRLGAWASLFLEEADPAQDRVFVTHSREAMALVEEFTAGFRLLGHLGEAFLNSDALTSIFEGGGDLFSNEAAVCPKMYITSSEHVFAMLNRFADLFQKSTKKTKAYPFDIKKDILFLWLP